MPALDQLLGPTGLTIALIVAVVYIGRLVARFVWQLWQMHVAGDEKLHEANDVLVATLPDMAESLKTLTAIVDERLTAPTKARGSRS